jgi:non-specific serine/threonine protein kinase
MEYEHYSYLLSHSLTEEELKREWMIGTSLTPVQAVAYAQQIFDLREINTAIGKKTGDLTVREREIAVLIGQGKTNGEIAEELVLSKRTIEKHMAHILIKLGFANRAQIVRWAIENGLVKSTK